MNAYYLDTASATTANTSIARWGGDDISRYNFQTNTTNSASDWYFENFTGAGNMWGGGSFTGLLSTAHSIGSKTLGTAPVLGWVANSTVGACSFTQAAYPGQQSYNGTCGDGIDPDGTNRCTNSGGCDIYGSDTIAAITSLSKPAPTPPTASAPSCRPSSPRNCWWACSSPAAASCPPWARSAHSTTPRFGLSWAPQSSSPRWPR